MASIRKKGNKYLAEVRVKTFYAAKTFSNKLDAQSWAIEQERQRGKHKGMPVAKTLAQAFDRYVKDVAPTHKGAHWEEIRIEKLKRDQLADIILADLSTQDLQDWIDRQETSGSTIRREFNLIRSTLKIARKKWKWLDHEPQRDVTLPKENPSRQRRPEGQEIKLILEALGYMGAVTTPRHEIAVGTLLALETAMRQGEIWGMDWSNVHLAKHYVFLPDTKNGMSRDVPLSKKAIILLKSMPKPHKGRVFKIPQATASTMFRRACELAGIDNLHFHDLRHEAITQLARKLSMLELARMVGHRDPRSLSIYYNATATELASKLN